MWGTRMLSGGIEFGVVVFGVGVGVTVLFCVAFTYNKVGCLAKATMWMMCIWVWWVICMWAGMVVIVCGAGMVVGVLGHWDLGGVRMLRN